MDEADAELEMADDPFMEAGISIPEELPYRSSRFVNKLKGVLINFYSERASLQILKVCNKVKGGGVLINFLFRKSFPLDPQCLTKLKGVLINFLSGRRASL